MKCLRCNNEDSNYFYKGSKGYYCRKCVKFKRIILLDELEPLDYEITDQSGDFNISYPLTSYQIKASELTYQYLSDYDVLLNCVCGAGKTEIVVKSMSEYLKKGLKVCYAVSRREVVIELTKRFSKIFKYADIAVVYGGHSEKVTGDLIVCTNHQLYRYYKTFDLLILDEVDAFPLKGDDTLMNISLNACKGKVIFSTATLNSQLENVLKKRKYKTVNLYVRPSLKPLIIPKVFYSNKFVLLIILFIIMSKTKNQCIIFVPSVSMCESYYKLFKRFYSCTYVHSKLELCGKNIKDFRDNKFKFIFSTTLLERGITIKDIDVIILDFNSKVFDEGSLIQMLGRVGRNINNPYGSSYILANHFSKDINKAISNLKLANSYL